MRFKLLFAPDGKRIYGAQIVGRDGVDKRIDVIATAMRGNLGVWDLSTSNWPTRRRTVPPRTRSTWPAHRLQPAARRRGLLVRRGFFHLPPNVLLLDVRTPVEFETWHIPGAINLPLGQLRAKHATLDKTRPIYTYCKVGLRSYLAYRILKQEGFQVKNLAGGADFFRAFYPDLTPTSGKGVPTMNQNLTESEAGASTKNYEPRTTNFSSKLFRSTAWDFHVPARLAD